MGGIQIVNFRGGSAVRVDGSACIPGDSVPKTFYVYPALGTSLQVANLSSEVVCPLLQE